MSWSKLDDSLSDHPKAIEAGPALALWTRCLAWCARHHTDGLIPRRVALGFAGDLASDPLSAGTPDGFIARLVSVGLWEPAATNFRVHDYCHYHESRATWQARSAADAERKRRERGMSGRTDAGHGEDTPRTDAGQPADPTRARTRARASESESESESEVRDPKSESPDLLVGTSAELTSTTQPPSALGEYIRTTWPKGWPASRALDSYERAWADACPGVDLLAEAKKARAWQLEDLARRTRPKPAAFLGNWFREAQSRASRITVVRGPPAKPEMSATDFDLLHPKF